MRRVNLLRAPPRERAEYNRKYRAEHREEFAERGRKYHAEHSEEDAERSRKYRAEHPEEIASYRLMSQYGIDVPEWNELLASQGGCCGCCGTDDPGSKSGWHTDHDHKTGKVRGILCRGCNLGLGHFVDDPRRLMAGIKYLAAVKS